jgi:hypothetical protein
MKPFYYFVVILNLPLICEAGTLKMHVFQENSQANTAVEPVALAGEKPMDMVIFANEEPPQSSNYIAPETPNYEQNSSNDFTFDYEINTGYQQDELSWQVGNASSSNQTKWKTDSAGIGAAFDVHTPMGVVFKGGGSYVWTVDGTGQEVSYLGEGGGNKPFSNVSSNASNGYGWDLSLATGYEFKFGTPRNHLSITPLAGYAWQERKDTLSNGKQQAAGFAGSTQSNKDNIYLSNWSGPWLGLDVELTLLKKHQLFSDVEYHWADYKANANWQQVADLKHPDSFVHNGNATGVLASAGYRYKLSQQLAMKIAVDYQKWQVDNGHEQMTFSDGTQIHSTINKINREAIGVNLGVNYAF